MICENSDVFNKSFSDVLCNIFTHMNTNHMKQLPRLVFFILITSVENCSGC